MLCSAVRSWYTGCRPGYVTLISVLVTGAVGAAIGISLVLLGLGFSRTGFADEQSGEARALANACAEEALQRIRDNIAFAGTGSLTLGHGTCGYAVADLGGETRSITATSTVGTIRRKTAVTIDRINPSITIASWQDVADF